MLNALQLSRPTRRPTALLAALLASLLVAGPLAGPVMAQSTLIAPAQTKEEAKQAREAADAAKDDGGGISLEAILAISGALLIAGATAYMLRDSKQAVVDEQRRARPITPGTTRGAPKTMFEGEARPGGQVGKNKKRTKSKRQKQARRANRPR